MRAAVSSGRSPLAHLAPDEAGEPGRRRRRAASIGAAALGSAPASNAVARTVITLIGVAGLHRRERVAGVDGAHEGVGRRPPRRCRTAAARRAARRRAASRSCRAVVAAREDRAVVRAPAPAAAAPGPRRAARRRRVARPAAPWRRPRPWPRPSAAASQPCRRPGDATSPPSACGGGDRVQRRRRQRALSCSATTRTRHQITFASLRSLSTSSATLPP